LDIRAIFSAGGRDNFLRELREYQRDQQRGADGIDGGQLTSFRWCTTGRLAGDAPPRSPIVGDAP
jgi:hypothetical protein